jgi:hypothetical protein
LKLGASFSTFVWPLGTADGLTAFLKSLGLGASWKCLSSSLFTLLGKKCPALAFLRFSNLRNSTSVIIPHRKNSKSASTRHRPMIEPNTQRSACLSLNFVPYVKTMKMAEHTKTQQAMYGMSIVALKTQGGVSLPSSS